MEKKNFNLKSLQDLVTYLCTVLHFEFWHETDDVLALKSDSSVVSSAALANVGRFGFECFCSVHSDEILLNIIKSGSL